MLPTRRARMESVIREELSQLVLREIKDPRVQSATFTQVQVSPDGKQANIFVSVFSGHHEGRDKLISNCVKGLESASGYIRRHLARVLTSRNIPALVFKADRGLENSMRVHELLQQIQGENKGHAS